MAPSPPSDSALAFMAKREKLKMEKEGCVLHRDSTIALTSYPSLSAQTQWKVAAVKSYFDHYYDELYTFLAERKARYELWQSLSLDTSLEPILRIASSRSER